MAHIFCYKCAQWFDDGNDRTDLQRTSVKCCKDHEFAEIRKVPHVVVINKKTNTRVFDKPISIALLYDVYKIVGDNTEGQFLILFLNKTEIPV